MQLEKLEYCQFEGQPNEWKLEGATFENINLIVGKNATGKSRVLNIIGSLANILSRARKLPYLNGKYKVHFKKNKKSIIYSLEYKEEMIIKEKLVVDKETLMTRMSDGKGKIVSTQFKEKMNFQTSINEVAAFTKRDSIQHPFLDDLYTWAEYLIHFRFGTPLGKDKLIALNRTKTDKSESQIDLKDTNEVLRKLQEGINKFGSKFISQIRKDMASLGYEIKNIELGSPVSFRIESGLQKAPLCLIVKEADLKGKTDQNDMSQGMFRALSLIVQINYVSMSKVSSCILIDDIGEGLDYERSTSLIKLIVKKAKDKAFQLIMATNDRFVMNNVALQHWSIINRLGNKSVLYNSVNSKNLFNEFEMIGLDNFDFFSSNYYLKGLRK